MHATIPTSVPSAADRVYHYVRDSILTRRFADNDLLAEGRLAEAVGVSRTPVREALLRLESDGMVRLLPKRGALVLPVTAAEARDVLDTREVVETHCVRRVLDGGRGPALAATLRDPLDRLRSSATAGDLAGYVAADRDFHACIVRAAGNQILIRLYSSLRDRQLRMGADNLLDENALPDPARMSTTMADHQELADAIGRQDLQEALRLTAAHLLHAARNLT